MCGRRSGRGAYIEVECGGEEVGRSGGAYVEVEYGELVERGERVAYAGELGWGRGWYGEGEGVAGG